MAAATLTAAPIPSIAGIDLPGDCNGDSQVGVSELIVAVNILLERRPLSDCPAADVARDGRVTIDELVRAVRAALGERPTPTQGGSGGVANAAQAAGRLVVVSKEAIELLHNGLAALDPSVAGVLNESCPRESCTVRDGQAVRTLTYVGCTAPGTSGNVVVRDGEIVESVGDPTFCETGDRSSATNWRVEWRNFVLRESNAPGEEMARLDATLTVVVEALELGCAGPGSVQTVDGTLTVHCREQAESIACPAGGAVRRFTAQELGLDQRSGGFPCERGTIVNGRLAVDDTLTSDLVEQTFRNFTVNRIERERGEDVTLSGGVSVACVGDVVFATEEPLRFTAQQSCPIEGTVHVTEGTVDSPQLPVGVHTTASARNEMTERKNGDMGAAAADAGDAEAAVESPTAFRDHLFRAANGQVYQVIQNTGSDAELGADAVRITTVVGVSAESIAQCATSAGAHAAPQAVVAAAVGRALSPDGVVKSSRIADASAPCFNRNGRDGAGLICIGPDCTADCSCVTGSQCTTFTQAEGAPISVATTDIPAATLVDTLGPLREPCSGFENRATYRFGDSGPSTEEQQCGLAPADGFVLPSSPSSFAEGVDGTTVVLVYTPPPLAPFSAGSAGFPIDVDGVNRVGCTGTERVLSLGRATFNTVAGARITYDGGGVAHDYDGDGSIDKTIATCLAVPLRACDVETGPPPDAECAAIEIGTGTTHGSTNARGDRSGEAPCNWGGGKDAPDVVYDFVAPATGSYAIRIRDANFDPLLWIKDGDCTGSQLQCPAAEDCGCAYDGNGSRTPEADVELVGGQRIAVIVDGSDGENGSFTLEVNERQPDLVIGAMSVPDAAIARDQALVAATIVNQGDGDAGPFEVQFVYARDAALTQPVLVSVFSCRFAGLPAGHAVTCGSPSLIEVPIVAAGEYFLGAIVDANGTVRERDESNNTRSTILSIGARGVELEHLLFRSMDGTAYQVISAIPAARPTDAESYRVLMMAGSVFTFDDCKVTAGIPGLSTFAIVGVDPVRGQTLHPLSSTLRTAILRPSDSTRITFDAVSSGRVGLGGRDGALNVCLRPDDCPDGIGAPLMALNDPNTQSPTACQIQNVTDPCIGNDRSLLGFGASLDPDAFVCTRAPTTAATVCGTIPADGFTLQPGESVIFVYEDAGPNAFTVGVAGFAIDENGDNLSMCPADTVLFPFADTQVQGTAPFTRTPTPACAVAGNPTCTPTVTDIPTATSTPTPTGQFQINTSAHYFTDLPSIAVNPGGEFVVVWDSYGQDGNIRGVFGQRFDSNGVPEGNDFQVNTYVTGLQFDADITAGPSGQFVVVWGSFGQDGSGLGVFGRRFQSDGIPERRDFQINTYTEGHQQAPAVAADPFGGFVAVWDSRGLEDTTQPSVRGQRFGSNGAPIGTEFQVGSSPGSSTAYYRVYPAVTSDEEGNFIVVWQSVDGILAQRFGQNGERLGTELLVSNAVGDAFNPAVAAEVDEGFVIVWVSLERGIIGRRFSSSGDPRNAEFEIGSTGAELRPTVAADPTGGFVVVWNAYGEDLEGYVVGQRYGSNGNALGPELRIGGRARFPPSSPSVGVDSRGNAVVVWRGPGGILGRRLEKE